MKNFFNMWNRTKNACLLLVVLIYGCTEKAESEENNIVFTVQNELNLERTFETISLTKATLGLLDTVDLQKFGVKNRTTNELMVRQYVDEDGDGSTDVLLFQPQLKPREEGKYQLVMLPKERKEDTIRVYSRFVPERTDDYTWENTRVAFRTFGPTAQKMVEDEIEGGTLASGMDCWLKRVEYPIIDKWYKENDTEPGAYHIDTGEGVDNFHVGKSRGCGGIAKKVGDTYYFSKNYRGYKTIANGPVRTSFVLEYASWSADSIMIKETKHISLDHGSNLTRFETLLKGTDEISAGLTLHENDGQVTADDDKGWLSYWQPHEDSELGTGIVAAKQYYRGHEKYETEEPDLSNAYAHLKVTDNKTVYYAGFGWKKSGQFKNEEEWQAYLSDFATRLASPLKISLR